MLPRDFGEVSSRLRSKQKPEYLSTPQGQAEIEDRIQALPKEILQMIVQQVLLLRCKIERVKPVAKRTLLALRICSKLLCQVVDSSRLSITLASTEVQTAGPYLHRLQSLTQIQIVEARNDASALPPLDVIQHQVTNLASLTLRAGWSGVQIQNLHISLMAWRHSLTHLDLIVCRMGTSDADGECTGLLQSWIPDLPVLTSLTVVDSALRALDLSGCPKLCKLEVSMNRMLASLSGLSGSQSLLSVKYSHNRAPLAALDLSGCSSLLTLECMNNSRLGKFNVSGCHSLQALDCGCSDLTVLEVADCRSLVVLKCSGSMDADSRPMALDLRGCTEMKQIECSSIPTLISLNLAQLQKLETVKCENNARMVSVDLRGCTAVTGLMCQSNSVLATLNLAGCVSLLEYEPGGKPVASNGLYTSRCPVLKITRA